MVGKCQAAWSARPRDGGSIPSHISMKAQDYILSTVTALKEPIVIEPVSKDNLEDTIYSRVMSKKFRKLKAGDDAVRITKNAIKIAAANNQPLRIVEMFGGNKLWRFDEAPEIDWAELFSLTYFVQWCRFISSVYEPGVIFEYFSQDISVESLNNVPRSETNKYSETFRELIKWIEPYLPTNIKIRYIRHYELFDNPAKYYEELEFAKEVILKNNNGRLPKLTPEMRTATELNVKLNPGQDKEPEWQEQVELQHQAIFKTKTLREYADNPNIIWTCPTYYSDSVVTGSTKNSLAKFWAGVGALRPQKDSLEEIILTPKQLEQAKYGWEKINIPGLPGKNFEKVRILES